MALCECSLERNMLSTTPSISHASLTEDEADLGHQPPSPSERLILSDVHARDSEAPTHAVPQSVDNDDDAGYESMTNTNRNLPESHNAGHHRAYKPWSLRRDVLLGLLVILLAMIIALELLYRVSKRNHGLATLSENERYIWRYGPTAGEYWAVC